MQKTKSFYRVRFKSYGQNAEIGKFLIFLPISCKFKFLQNLNRLRQNKFFWLYTQVLRVQQSIKTKKKSLSPMVQKLWPKAKMSKNSTFFTFPSGAARLQNFFSKKKIYVINLHSIGEIFRTEHGIQEKVCSFCNTLLLIALYTLN